MTHLDDAKAAIYAFVHDDLEMPSAEEPSRDELQTVLDALDELENSYVPHLPAETDTWLRDAQSIAVDHPLPPESQVKFHYGPGQAQYLIARATDAGLRIYAERGWLTLTSSSPNVFTIIGSTK